MRGYCSSEAKALVPSQAGVCKIRKFVSTVIDVPAGRVLGRIGLSGALAIERSQEFVRDRPPTAGMKSQ
jgi:hypothetical protein